VLARDEQGAERRVREDRYVELLWPAFRLVNDLDDTREARYGVYCSQKKPLTLAASEDVPRI
jgi:hypothetical protein